MEPERKIEKLLRAYAKKRRAEAGDALEGVAEGLAANGCNGGGVVKLKPWFLAHFQANGGIWSHFADRTPEGEDLSCGGVDFLLLKEDFRQAGPTEQCGKRDLEFGQPLWPRAGEVESVTHTVT